MFRWLLSQSDLWIAHEHGGVQMDVPTERLLAAHKQAGTMIQMDTEAKGLPEEPE